MIIILALGDFIAWKSLDTRECHGNSDGGQQRVRRLRDRDRHYRSVAMLQQGALALLIATLGF
jgi:hypothetical protein